MRTVTIYSKGEHVLVEMEIYGRELKGDNVMYSLKMPGNEDYLDSEYSFDVLIPIENENENENEKGEVK